MTAYRDQYAKVTEQGAQVVAISADDAETLKKFKESLAAPFIFASDPGGKVAAQYGGVTPEGMAKRATFVVAKDGTISHVDEGKDAINPEPAVNACAQKSAPSTI